MTIIKTVAVIMCIVVISSSKKKDKEDCDGIKVRDIPHRKVVLAENIDRPYQLSYYKHKEILFFSYNIGNEEEDTFKIGYLHNHTHEHKTVEVENGFATAVDESNHAVYFGGSSGIYKYHPDKNNSKAVKVIRRHNVWSLFLKSHLYFINYPSQHLYKVNVHDKVSIPVRVTHVNETIYNYAIDGNEDQYFTNSSGLYKIINGTHDRIHYKGETIFRGMAVNSKGEIYFCGKHGIFVGNKHNHTLEEIAHIKNIFGLTFDNHDNIIYSNPREIIKLLRDDSCKG